MPVSLRALALVATILALAGLAAEVADRAPPPVTIARDTHPVAVRAPQAPRVATGAHHHTGLPATIACGTCHATRTPDPTNRTGADLTHFHQGLVVAHGDNSCLSCHNPTDYDQLRLADGRSVPFERSIELCSQCHGPQRRDYDRGAHGGMNGFWDLSRGGRVRNTCIDCHDPHTPTFQGMLPMPPPRDRFLPAAGAAHD